MCNEKSARGMQVIAILANNGYSRRSLHVVRLTANSTPCLRDITLFIAFVLAHAEVFSTMH